ncbi:hypothetical protein [Pseudomonas japonica]|uniref:hypothetical protein n=1 Tax=Pseudomonas japonica TaxID=256466 RepID=UPI002159B4FC|nr:hypothetical protein [Pseudomonas japonica]
MVIYPRGVTGIAGNLLVKDEQAVAEFGDMGANTFAVLHKQLAPLGFGLRATRSKVGVAQHFPDGHSRRFQAVEKFDPH